MRWPLVASFAVASLVLAQGCKRDEPPKADPAKSATGAGSASGASAGEPSAEEFCAKMVAFGAQADEEVQEMDLEDQASFLAQMRSQCLQDASHDRERAPTEWAGCARCIVAAKDVHGADACEPACSALDAIIDKDEKDEKK